LVTGGSGFLGRNLQDVVEAIKRNELYMPGRLKDTVTCVKSTRFVFLGSKDGDLRDLKQVEAIFENYKPTCVIHLAARVGGLFANMQDKVGFYEDNMAINLNVVKCCHQFKVKTLLSALSTCIYPDNYRP
jgi:GDP-L-fucose synthase